MNLDPALLRPWRLPPNRVSRFYRMSGLMAAFRGFSGPDGDAGRPEDWVGSATRAWSPPAATPSVEGLGVAEVDGQRHLIADLLATDPVAVAGSVPSDMTGLTTGVLVKLLDAGVRLPVHAHPSRAFARRHLGSYFGKAEAWIVVATRPGLDAEGPGVRIGFTRDVAADELITLIETEDTAALLATMHHRPTAAGDVWFIPPGVPHAIGAGVFMIEVQEPSDFSIVAETRGVPIDRPDAHLGLGWPVAVGAFDREGHDGAWLDGLRHDGRRGTREGAGWRSEPLTAEAADPFFRAERLLVRGRAIPDWGVPTFLVGVVTGGAGEIRAGSARLGVRAGETFAVPAGALAGFGLHAADGLEIVICRPADPAHTEDQA
jgi:mannose-6-phosphate isomerase